ncbi:RagB/SusD family nutrient uptake outer membrane protein [Mucilaginibacter lacusdianchii]|uniref:RagB/SusD family nutrient uptake outer membrane protein n=1 Tax=Mucilaginibacter lacusdianchii TaxID=2684211 RepID=UPI00131AACFB|nr:RagB/SusD family nutrient uptake outer membrane protein [Mucilaginibacter sp. JXJ CY 39]
MKTINKITLMTGLIATSVLGSCSKDFLDQQPYTQVPVEEAVSTPASMASALNGAYTALNNVNLYGRTMPVFGDLRADNVFVSAANSGRYTSENNYSITVSDADVSGLWSNSYATILRTNNIVNAELNSADVQQTKGEAYALRALTYFNLVRLFARPYTDNPAGLGVPLITKYDPTYLPARATVSEVYALIMADLDKAYSMMTTYRGSGFFSKYSARALAAKVALTMGDYQKAYDYANDVIANSGFTLVAPADLNGYFASPSPHTDGSKVETLFEVGADNANNNSTDELFAIYLQANPATGGTTYGDLLATSSLYNLYSNTDARKQLIIAGKRDRPGGEAVAYFVNKYVPSSAGAFTSKKVLRMGEMYLIVAESAARLNNPTAALTALNTLMARRDPSLVYTSAGTQLINDIITERRKELAFEGDRFFDLNRLKADISRPAEYPSAARTIPYSDARRVLPIPQNELNVNPNVTQNPL